MDRRRSRSAAWWSSSRCSRSPGSSPATMMARARGDDFGADHRCPSRRPRPAAPTGRADHGRRPARRDRRRRRLRLGRGLLRRAPSSASPRAATARSPSTPPASRPTSPPTRAAPGWRCRTAARSSGSPRTPAPSRRSRRAGFPFQVAAGEGARLGDVAEGGRADRSRLRASPTAPRSSSRAAAPRSRPARAGSGSRAATARWSGSTRATASSTTRRPRSPAPSTSPSASPRSGRWAPDGALIRIDPGTGEPAGEPLR